MLFDEYNMIVSFSLEIPAISDLMTASLPSQIGVQFTVSGAKVALSLEPVVGTFLVLVSTI